MGKEMKRKRYRSYVLVSLLLLCVCLTGCGGGQAEKEAVTICVKTPNLSMNSVVDADVTESVIFLQKAADAFVAQYEEADVTVNLVQFYFLKEDRAIPECFDTENAADVLYEGYFNMATYIHTGRVVPLDDIISDELRADIDEKSWDMSQLNGKTYMMPYLSLQNTLVYNKQILRDAGLERYISDEEEIQNWTMEEWETILSTLKEKMPDNQYIIPLYAGNNQGDTHIMTLIRCKGSNIFGENGRFHVNTPEGIAGLQWVKDCYDKGYAPAHCEDMEISDMAELFYNGQMAFGIGNNAMNANTIRFDYGMVNFPNIDSAGKATSFVTGFEVFDNGDAAKLQVAKDFVQYIYETEEWMDYAAGGIPVSHRVAETYADDIYMGKAFFANNVNVVDFTMNNPNWRGVREAFYPNIQDLLTGRKTPAEVAAQLDADCNAAIEHGYKESQLHE